MKPRLRLCIYITIMLLFLTGCGEKIIRAPQVPMQVKQPFQTAVSIRYGDLNTEAILSKETDQNFRLERQKYCKEWFFCSTLTRLRLNTVI